jgi:hypothetical protein
LLFAHYRFFPLCSSLFVPGILLFCYLTQIRSLTESMIMPTIRHERCVTRYRVSVESVAHGMTHATLPKPARVKQVGL